jgi:hypothetical protein
MPKTIGHDPVVEHRHLVAAPRRPRHEAVAVGLALLTLALLVLSWAVVGSRTSTVPPGWHEFRDDAKGYSVAYPPGYEVRRTSSGVTFVAPAASGLELSVTALPFFDMTVERLAELEAFEAADLGAADAHVQPWSPIDGRVSTAISERLWSGEHLLRVFVQGDPGTIFAFDAQGPSSTFDDDLVDLFLASVRID